jgi:ribosomal protein S18 acetylase RimI-like enzyme
MKEDILSILENDRIWCAYAIADLDPEHDAYCEWHVFAESVLLSYSGLEPPVLFAHGEQEPLRALLKKIPSGEYQISFPEIFIGSLPEFARILHKIPMWRMWFSSTSIDPPTDFRVKRLNLEHINDINSLYAEKHDAPDGYHPRQLELGPFVGVWNSETLVATAGVHVLSTSQRVAAIGNIYTHPDHRRRGLARACTASVLSLLIEMGVMTIVLNVAQDNHAAVALYQQLGFEMHCPFYEGAMQIEDHAY